MPVPRPSVPPRPTPSPYVPKILAGKLGSGMAIPMSIFQNQWQIINGEAKVQQDMVAVIITPVDRRLGQPDFGSMIPYMIHEQYTRTLQREMINKTKEALLRWVPQILVETVTVDLIPPSNVIIAVTYLVKGTSAFNILKLSLSQDGTAEIDPTTFTINGQQII